MRTVKEKVGSREATFKVATKTHDDHDWLRSESNEEEAWFMRKLKWGSSEYKGKLPFKLFSCGKIGIYASKCAYGKIDNECDEKKRRNIGKSSIRL